MGVRPGYVQGRGVGGGTGNADIGILLRQAGEDDKGIFVSHRSGDLTWHAQGEARRDAEAAAAAALTFVNEDQDAQLDVTLPLDWAAPPETQNARDILYVRYPNPFAGSTADSLYGALQIAWGAVGAAGNSQRYRATAGTAAVAAQNAKADIEGSRGVTPDHQGVIRVTAPDSTASGLGASASNDNDNNLVVTWHEAGTEGDGFALTFRVANRDTGMSTNDPPRIEAAYASDNRSMLVTAHIGGAASLQTPYSSFAAAINAARTSGGEQLVTAVGTATRFVFFSSRNVVRTIDELPRMELSGGTRAAGPGAATNVGEVRVVSSGARVAGTAATYVWQIAAGRQITLTFHEVGVAGNNLQFSIREDTTNLNANTVSVLDSGADFLVRYNGSVTLGTLVDAMNAAGSRFTVAITQGSRADSVTPSGNVAWRTSGGVDEVNPLSAVWDADEHRLTVTALASDTFDDVRTAIIALSEFQIGDGTSAGDVAFEDGALTSDTIDVDSTVGEAIDYAFSGGTDAVARTPLTVSERFIANIGGVDSYILDILNVLNTDTVQDAIDAYSGSNFRLAAASGRQATDTLSGNRVASTQLTGGADAVPRLPPEVTMADDGRLGISLHAQNGRADNTTLAELEAAFDAATYTDTDGATQTFDGAALDVTGGGAGTDPIRNESLPPRPSGGRNEVLANVTEAEARPDDDVDGPNILLKYDDADDLDTIIAGFEANNNGGFTFTLVYGTDGTANPEEPPFTRSFYDGGLAEAPSTGTGGITEGQAEGIVRQLTKGYALKGGPDVPDSEIGSEIARDSEIKGFARTGGPVVPESEIDGAIARDAEIKPYARTGGGDVDEGDIPDSITRDSEVPGLVSDALTLRGPGAGRTDEVPYLTRGGAWSKATTETFRELFASHVGTWPVANGFVFRVGDLTDHDGRVYFVNTQHTANTTDGPETNAHYTPLDNWVGTITQNWYRAGSLGVYNGGLYGAIADVVNTDALPSVDHAKWLLLSHDSRSILEGGAFNNAATYKANRIVRKSDAAYLTLRDVPAGIDPGVSSNWTTYYFRLGYVDGAPDSLVGAPTVSGSGELVTQTRGGHENRVQLPSGGTTVAANPAGTTGDEITRISIAGTDYNLPNPTIPEIGRTERIAFQDEDNVPTGTAAELTPATTNPISVVAGTGAASLLSGVSGNDFMVKAGLYFLSYEGEARAAGSNASVQFEVRQASDNAVLATTSVSYLGRTSDGWIAVSKTKLLSLAQDTLVNVAAHSVRETSDVRNMAVAFTEMFASANADSSVTPSPSISSYTLLSGEQHPVAGSIARDRYGVAWQIAQTDHVGSVRILGFKGAYGDGTGATVLLNIDHGASSPGQPNIGWSNGEAQPIIPAGVSLADGETYTLRLQVFEEGVTSPALTAAPAAYQDIVIVAHAAATANYHWGRLPRVANKTAAAYAADIVFGTTGSGTDLVTGGALDTTNGYDATPDSTGDWIFYLAAKADEQQPSGWTTGGLPASAVFQSAVTQAFNSVDYSVYVMQDLYYRTDADGSENYTPTVS